MLLLAVLQFLTIILSPLYIVRFHFGPFPSTALEVLLVSSLLVFLIELLRSKAKLKEVLKTTYDIPILLLLSAAASSVAVSSDRIGGLGILKAYFIEPIIFYYSLVYTAKRLGIKYLTVALFTAGWWLSALAILQKLTHRFSLAPIEILQDRVTAVFNSANSLALFLGPLVILSTALLLGILRQRTRIFFALSLIVFFTVTVWTKSRGGLFGQGAAILVLLYVVLTRTRHLLKRVWPAIILLLVGAMAAFLFLAYHNADTSHPDTMRVRFAIWAGTIYLLKDNPVFGAGLNGFVSLYSQKYRTSIYQELVQYPHNLLLTFWSETGLLGLAAFVGIVVVFFSRMWQKVPNSSSPLVGAGLLGAMVYLLVHGIVDVPYFKNDLSLQFWVIMALSEWFLHSFHH